ncbi:MAG TPA: serine hydrolase domain-containing protein, partial [Phycisphaerales bacterium]|nr:serine hydrolase domain-containing protein [Phycisphaerales bacterium]
MMHRAAWLVVTMAVMALSAVARGAEPGVEDLVGHWTGTIKLPGQELPIDLDFQKGDSGVTGDISIPMQAVKDSPLTDVKVSDGMYRFKFPVAPGNATFECVINESGTIAGSLLQAGQRFPFTAKRAKTEAASVQEALEGYDEAVERIRATWKAPGLSLVIVKGSEVVHAAGYGKRDVDNDQPVTTKTLFAIGSSTKAFTTFVMGTLVDDRKLEFDKPVIETLPDFRLKDETATRLMTPRDLVTHRSGLPRHDVMWYNSGLTRQQMYERLRYLEPNESFRGAWQYNNLMFLTAGYLVERVTGKSWEENVRARVFTPLGMARSNFSVKDSAADADHAEPYSEKDAAVNKIAFRDIAEIGPAGSINSCADDLAPWLIVHLNEGKLNGREVIRASTLKELHSPQMIMPSADDPTTGTITIGYAMGWMVDVYRGHRRVHHGGNIDGFSAAVVLYPDDGLGIAVLTNMNGSPVPDLVAQVAADRVLGLEQRDWSTEARVKYEAAKAVMKEGEKKREEMRIANAPATHPL